MKKSGILAVAAVIVVAALVVCAVYILPSGEADKPTNDDGSTQYIPSKNYEYVGEQVDSSNWNYWFGNLDLPGVSDSKTPTNSADLVELWKIADVLDGGSMVWDVPGSAICVGDKTYFFRGSEDALYCVTTATGKVIAKAECVSDSVYNMAIAYGDGKIFVPCRSVDSTVLKVFDANTLKQLYVSQPVSGGEVQGSIVYHEGAVYFGTYNGDYACFSSEDIDPSVSNEAVQPLWVLEGSGWYNATPAFAGNYCIIAEKGYDIGGLIIYVLDSKTGAVYDTHKISHEYCVSGLTMYKGRVYVAANATSDPSYATSEDNRGKNLVIHSYEINSDGTLDISSEKKWKSDIEDGGTQATPLFYNDRLYIGGGGSTMGTNEPFTVLNIAADGTMSSAYSDRSNGILTKSSAAITTAYATEENDYAVYIYIIEYGTVKTGDSTGLIGSADIKILKDTKGQTELNVVGTLTPSVEQFAFQSFTISPDGYLLIRNDSTLFCYGPKEASSAKYAAEDVVNAIDRVASQISKGNYVNFKEVGMIEYRYASLSESEKSKVTNYQELQDLYCTVSFVVSDSETIEVKVPKGSIAHAPFFKVSDDKIFSGWETKSSKTWNIWEDRVTEDVTLIAKYEQTVKVSFDSNGGSSVNLLYVGKGGVMGYVCEPERSGYTFAGWFLNSTEYTPQHTKVSSDVTLKAKWLGNHTISFDSNGGSNVDTKMQVTTGMEIGKLPATSRSGYTFLGWYSGDTKYTDGMTYSADNDVTLKAKWKENTSSTISTAKGVTATGTFPADVKIGTVVPYEFGSTVLKIKQTAGVSLDFIQITISGDGVSGDIPISIGLPVGESYKSAAVYYYDNSSNSVKTVNGTIAEGMLNFTLKGNTTSSGIDVVIGIPAGSDLPNHI